MPKSWSIWGYVCKSIEGLEQNMNQKTHLQSTWLFFRRVFNVQPPSWRILWFGWYNVYDLTDSYFIGTVPVVTCHLHNILQLTVYNRLPENPIVFYCDYHWMFILLWIYFFLIHQCLFNTTLTLVHNENYSDKCWPSIGENNKLKTSDLFRKTVCELFDGMGFYQLPSYVCMIMLPCKVLYNATFNFQCTSN